LVSVVLGRDVSVINTAVHADGLPEVVDLVQTQLAVLVKEDDAVLDGKVWVSFEVPQIQQVFIVQQDQRIPEVRSHTSAPPLNINSN